MTRHARPYRRSTIAATVVGIIAGFALACLASTGAAIWHMADADGALEDLGGEES